MHRAIFGSNRWTHSALRQWMNSDAAGNAWWTPQNNFDRPSSNAASAGFLKDMDAAFLNVVGYVNKTTQKSVVDGYGLESTSERFFLPSRPEMYMGTERSTDGPDGTVYAYYGSGYSDLTAPGTGADAHRIKYKSGTAYYWWLRTPHSGYGHYVRYVGTDGSLGSYYAGNSSGVAPACAIV